MDLAGPVLLFWMMSVVGLELTPADFRRVAAYPTAVLLGTLGQWTVLPLATAGLIAAMDLAPHMAAGLVLLAAAPGGGISNVFTYLAGANVALSVTLTAVSSLLAVVALPVVVATGFAWFVGQEGIVDVPVAAMIGQLAVLVLLPIALGMAIRGRWPAAAVSWAGRMRRGVLVAIVLLMGAGLASDQSGLAMDVFQGLIAALLWTFTAAAIGFAAAWLLGLDGGERFAFVIEYSVKNIGLVAIIALSEFKRPDFAVAIGAYALTGYPLAALAAWGYRRIAVVPTFAQPEGEARAERSALR